MSCESSTDDRTNALRRARDHSPFLRDTINARSDIADAFLSLGAGAAANVALQSVGDNLAASLRRQRQALALAVALGDLSGEFTLEEVTRLLSDFADSAIDQAIHAAIASESPTLSRKGSLSSQWGSLAAMSLTIPPTSTCCSSSIPRH